MSKTTYAVKKFFVLIIALSISLLSVAVHAQQENAAATFTSKEGGFSVRLPGKPTEKTEEISSNNGPTTLHTFMVDQGQRFFLVGYSDYQTKLDVSSSLENVVKGQVESLKGKITSDKSVTLAGYQGRSVTIETEETIFFSTVYVAGNRLYQLMSGRPKSAEATAGIKEFFDSFRILP